RGRCSRPGPRGAPLHHLERELPRVPAPGGQPHARAGGGQRANGHGARRARRSRRRTGTERFQMTVIRVLLALAVLTSAPLLPPLLADPGSPPTSDPLPGAAPFGAELQQRLMMALREKGANYHPHTRHLRPDPSPRYPTRLILESSPYLLQHAHNPVDWYPWGDEAFARAAAEAKPVLLSVGYSTCHWCHVMEEESFENEEIATYLNQHYI